MGRITDIDKNAIDTIVKLITYYIEKEPGKILLCKGREWNEPIIKLELDTGMYKVEEFEITFTPDLSTDYETEGNNWSYMSNIIVFEHDFKLFDIIKGTKAKLEEMVLSEYQNIREVKLQDLLDRDNNDS